MLCLFGATLLFLIAYGEGDDQKDYRELLDTDDVLILVIVMTRYVVQVVRIVYILKKAKNNRELHSEMKKIDLNMLEITHNNSINFQDLKADELVKDKMRKRHELVE